MKNKRASKRGKYIMTKKAHEKIDGNAENWESGILGNDEQFAKLASDVTSASADDMLALQLISIRLQKSMICDLKFIAEMSGINGYQPLIRRVLDRFVLSEMKRLARENAPDQMKTKVSESKDPHIEGRARKRA
jgi:predicted DNA binding CopG/RHH family protein